MIDIMDAARYLIHLSYQEKPYSCTCMKLQKILYLAQGWHRVWDDKPLFAGDFIAGEYGPYSETIRKTFQAYGRNELPETEGISSFKDTGAAETLQAVWKEYGKCSAFILASLCMGQEPWIAARSGNKLIPDTDIWTYFKSIYGVGYENGREQDKGAEYDRN